MALPVNLYEVVGRGMPLRYAVAGCITGMPECRTEGRKIEDLAEAEDRRSYDTKTYRQVDHTFYLYRVMVGPSGLQEIQKGKRAIKGEVCCRSAVTS